MAEWFFRKKSKGEVERDPGWNEYFTFNRSTEESLVREATHNFLAAHSKCESLESQSAPARVCIYYSGKAKPLQKDAYAKYLAGAADLAVHIYWRGACPRVVRGGQGVERSQFSQPKTKNGG